MLAIKANKQYTITDEQKERYLADGYDIADDNGNICEYSPKKTVPYSEYLELKKKKGGNDKALQERIKALEKENAGLKKEISKA